MTVAITRREILFNDVILQPNGPQIELQVSHKPDWLLGEKRRSRLLKIARLLVHLDYVAHSIANANHSVM
jgi:hypothetical protein